MISIATAFAAAISVTIAISPGLTPPTLVAGCSQSYSQRFYYDIMNTTSTSNAKRQTENTFSLQNGIMTDTLGRTGYIASNRQLQFDFFNGQAGTIFNDGFSICPNGTLALQSAVWYACLSGTFYNLYDRSQGAQCHPVFIEAVPAGGSVSVASWSSVSVLTTSTSSVSRIIVTVVHTGKPKTRTGPVVTELRTAIPTLGVRDIATRAMLTSNGGSRTSQKRKPVSPSVSNSQGSSQESTHASSRKGSSQTPGQGSGSGSPAPSSNMAAVGSLSALMGAICAAIWSVVLL